LIPSPEIIDQLKEALSQLDQYPFYLNGRLVKASQYYHLEFDPPHILFNTNCPEVIQESVRGILRKFIPEYETGQFGQS
jgi:hypothetical protein